MTAVELPGAFPTHTRAPAPEPAVALAAERALRAAVRDANRLFAGSRVGVSVTDAQVADSVTDALRQLGAHTTWAGEYRADFWVTDDPATATATVTSATGPQQSAVPAVSGSPAARIAEAAELMPVTRAMAEELANSGCLSGLRVAVSLVLEPKTAALALALRDAGAEVHVFGAVSETQPEVAAALASAGVLVAAPLAQSDPLEQNRIDAAHAAAVLDWSPELMIDDGAHLIRLAHTHRGGAVLRTLRAASEETTSGVRPLREMAATGELQIPVVAVNDARTKTEFDNRIGTGESCVFAIADALDPHRIGAPAPEDAPHPVAGTHWVVIGYGPVGVGVVRAARALGARISVVERDAVRALAAHHDGVDVGTLASLLAQADVVVSATGVWHTVTAADAAQLRPGAAIAVAGGIDDEVALDELQAAGWLSAPEPGRPGVHRWWAPTAAPESALLVLAQGGGVNYTIANGNPVEVMDLSFATQLAALAWLCEHLLPPGVYTLPVSAEMRVATAALAARGVHVDPPLQTRAGGAVQPWRVHRYRSETP